MPEGNATIQITLTTEYPDPANAELDWFSVSDGNVIQGTQYDEYDYLVTVPHNSEEFAIYAQAKNPYITPVLKQKNGSGDVDLGDTLEGLTEGLNEYEITVTSADENYTTTYKIQVIKLPNLSLAKFQVTNKDSNFVRDLAQLAKQNVYVPYSSVTVVADAVNGSGATAVIKTDSGNISSLDATEPVEVTVTVSKEIEGVDSIYKTASYALDLYYGDGMAVSPEAEGGNVSFIPGVPGEGNVYYEVHTFSEAGTYTLSFGAQTPSIHADYLIVGGGGGAGGPSDNNKDWGGGGGAGGLLYAGGTLTLAGGSLTVTVGKGGAGGAKEKKGEKGEDGGYSSLGDITVPGGGYGGTHKGTLVGGNGGSGGGNGSNSNGTEPPTTSFGQKHTAASNLGNTDVYSGVKGNSGGIAGGHPGGGGGGAGGPGGNGDGMNPGTAGAGGAGWKPSENGAAWIEQVTGTEEFSHGGAGGGGENSTKSVASGYGYGGNGSASNRGGCDGIVVIRFQRELTGNQN